MPVVNDQPTDSGPASPEPPGGAEATPAEPPDPAPEPGAETRATRRARREAERHRRPELSPLALALRPITVIATIALAALLLLGVVTDPVLLAAVLASTSLLLAWGWPRLLGSSSRFGSSFAIGVTGLLAATATALTTDQPYLRLVPVALAVGLGLMFGHQIVRRDGRPRLTESVGVTSFGLALVALGSAWAPMARSGPAIDLAVVAGVALAASTLADLVVVYERARPWMLPLAMVLGGAAGIVAASVEGSPGAATAALTGLVVAGVAHALRRTLTVLPGIGFLPSQLATAAAGLLVPGVVAYGLFLLLVG
jgi:hypothetical protein